MGFPQASPSSETRQGGIGFEAKSDVDDINEKVILELLVSGFFMIECEFFCIFPLICDNTTSRLSLVIKAIRK